MYMHICIYIILGYDEENFFVLKIKAKSLTKAIKT